MCLDLFLVDTNPCLYGQGYEHCFSTFGPRFFDAAQTEVDQIIEESTDKEQA